MSNSHLHQAKELKNDEFYTPFDEVKKECDKYLDVLSGKTIYSNCDGPDSAFRRYFLRLFADGVIPRFICSGRDPLTDDPFLIDTADPFQVPTTWDCFALENRRRIQNADVIITNPPFSLLYEFAQLCLFYKRNYLFVAPLHFSTQYAVRDEFVFRRATMGYNIFDLAGQKCYWITSFPVDRPKYRFQGDGGGDLEFIDGTDILFIEKTADIPDGWPGLMAVPLSTLSLLNAAQYDIIKVIDYPHVNGVERFTRFLIRLTEIKDDHKGYRRIDRPSARGLFGFFE